MRTLAARWILPGTSPPIAHGRVTIDGSRIVCIGGPDGTHPVDLDLGAVAILPGFVNAHTHLELGPIPWNESQGTENEVAWLGRVIRSRRDRSTAQVQELIQRNVRDAVAAGTTALADISTAAQSWDAVATAPVWGIVYAEILGLSRSRSIETYQAAVDGLNRIVGQPQDWNKTRPGLSPHAPYSTSGWLYWEASESGLPLTTHLGELPEERAFLTDRAGPLRKFVEGLGAWSDEWKPIGPSPINYLLPVPAEGRFGWIIAHGNIFESSEFARLVTPPDATGAQRVALAFCPRTHARFGHPPHPFRVMLAAGVVVCLGTDSLASSPSLSILDEVRFLHRHHPDVEAAVLLRMATIHGAWAMQIDEQTGSLEPGKSADLVVVPLEANRAADPYASWLDSNASPLATMFRGEVVAGSLNPRR